MHLTTVAARARLFAVWALNHHGDGHVGLWLNTPAMEQAALLASSRHLFKPPYVGPAGWIGIELNQGVAWETGVRAHAPGISQQLPGETRGANAASAGDRGAQRQDETR